MRDRTDYSSKKNESGVTLVELMVTMFLLSIIATLVITMLNTTLGVSRDIEDRAGGEAQAQILANNLAWEIRTGQKMADDTPVLAVANLNEITFYRINDLGATPTRYHYYLQADKLMKGYLVAQTGGPPWVFSGVEQAAEVGKYVRNSTGTPMFKYYKEDGTQITPQTATDRALIRKLLISVVCDIDTTKAPAAYTSSIEVRLRNQK